MIRLALAAPWFVVGTVCREIGWLVYGGRHYVEEPCTRGQVAR